MESNAQGKIGTMENEISKNPTKKTSKVMDYKNHGTSKISLIDKIGTMETNQI